MNQNEDSVVVSDGACRCCSAPTVQVHHRDYPEARAEGISAAMAAGHLGDQLARSLDHTPGPLQREAIVQALAEVRSFKNRHDPRPAAFGGRDVKGASLMAIPHAKPGEVINVRPLGSALADTKTTALVKSENLEVIRLVIPRGKEIPTHKTRGEVTVHCLEGRIAFTTGDVTHELAAGQLIYVQGEQPHSVLGIEDASLLVTIALPRYSPLAERLGHS